jgi:hypothetical protein
MLASIPILNFAAYFCDLGLSYASSDDDDGSKKNLNSFCAHPFLPSEILAGSPPTTRTKRPRQTKLFEGQSKGFAASTQAQMLSPFGRQQRVTQSHAGWNSGFHFQENLTPPKKQRRIAQNRATWNSGFQEKSSFPRRSLLCLPTETKGNASTKHPHNIVKSSFSEIKRNHSDNTQKNGHSLFIDSSTPCFRSNMVAFDTRRDLKKEMNVRTPSIGRRSSGNSFDWHELTFALDKLCRSG